MNNISQSWVYDGTEVIKTGREATRELKTPAGKVTRTMTLVEIKPIDEVMDWKKWVNPSELFVVQNPNK